MTTRTGDPATPELAATADEAGTAPGDRRFRPDVEGLRAVAVLLVVLYHAHLGVLRGGFVGVDVFFVISGFVITGLLLRERASTGRTSLTGFYGRRVRRILPAATLVIVVTVVATYAVLGAYYGDPTAVSARWTAVFLANVHFAAQGTDYLSATAPPSPLQNFWSLAVEEQFYLVFPALVLVVATWRSRVTLRTRLAVVLVPVIVASLLWSAHQTAVHPTAAFFSPFTRAWELALGALVATATPALLRLHRTIGAALTWVGLGAVALAATTYTAATPYPGTAALLPVVGTALMIAGGTPVPRAGAEWVLRLGPLQWFGRLSYSLYLWHWPILVLAAERAGATGLPFHRTVGWLLLAVVLAWASLRLVESPVRHARLWSGRHWLPLGVGAVLIATSLAVATVALDVSSPAVTPPTPLSPAQLQRTVAASVHLTTLPADLAPSLARVRNDWGGPIGPCWPAYPQWTVPSCTFGRPGAARTIVLYGDSHAAMWLGDVAGFASLFGYRMVLLTKGDCPYVDLPFAAPAGTGPPGSSFAACDRWHRWALARMAAEHPAVVVVSQEADLGPGGTHYSPATWAAATARAIGQLPVPAAHVIVLGNIPQPVHAGPACLVTHPGDVQACTGPNQPYTVSHTAAERLGAARAGAGYIDTVPWFCSTTCTDVIGRYQPYWDPYHVTATYAQVLAPTFASALLGQLRGRS